MDAFIAMASVAAQLLMARRYLENWICGLLSTWFAIGVMRHGLMLFAILYAAFLILSSWPANGAGADVVTARSASWPRKHREIDAWTA